MVIETNRLSHYLAATRIGRRLGLRRQPGPDGDPNRASELAGHLVPELGVETLPSYEEFMAVCEATRQILAERPESQAHFDFHRAPQARAAYQQHRKGIKPTEEMVKSYLISAIEPLAAWEISPDQYSRLQEIYGPAVIRLALIDRNLARFLATAGPRERILASGGICAQETIDTVIKDEVLDQRSNGRDLRRAYSGAILDMSPTFTQVTGAILPARGTSIIYDETFPWVLKIAQDGVPDYLGRTINVYDHAIPAAQRYAQLMHPDNNLLRIRFTDLALEENGSLERWFEEYRPHLDVLSHQYNLPPTDYNPDAHLKAWVDYTYHGSHILNIVKDVIRREYPGHLAEKDLQSFAMHVRGKQIDHLTGERANTWHSALVLNGRTDFQTTRKQVDRHAVRSTIAIGMWMRDSQPETIGMAGFLDYNWRGKIMHESGLRSISELRRMDDETLLSHLLSSPHRLHTGNLDQVLELLTRFTHQKGTVVAAGEVSLYLEHSAKLNQLNQKIERLENISRGRQIIAGILSALDPGLGLVEAQEFDIDYPKLGLATTAQLKDILKETIVTYTTRKNVSQILTAHPEVFGSDANLLSVLQGLLLTGEEFTDGKTGNPIYSLKVNGQVKLFKDQLLAEMVRDGERENLVDPNTGYTKLEAWKKDRNGAQVALAAVQTVMYNGFSGDLELQTMVSILPLCDNMFVSFMQQFLFVPAIRHAYLDIAAISRDNSLAREGKEYLIIAAQRQIYPIMTRCIRYVMTGRGNYPSYERFFAQYHPYRVSMAA